MKIILNKIIILFLFILLFFNKILAIHHFNNNEQFNCASLPPALWCSNDKIQEKCKTKEKCLEYTNSVKNQPVHITLLFESLCPDCQNFISKKLLDFWLNFKDFARIEFIPFGNAKILKNGTIQCQHGPEECRINKYESCAIHYMHEPLPFIHCLETKIADGFKLEKASKQCYAKLHSLPHIYDQIMHCFNGQKGEKLQKLAGEQTFNIWPDKHEFVPWILINNASLSSQQFFMNQLPTLICQSYVGDGHIKQCAAFGSINNLVEENNEDESIMDSEEYF